MSFEIYLKKDIQNQISLIVDEIPKKINVSTLDIADGLLTKGSYKIPIDHILFIKQV